MNTTIEEDLTRMEEFIKEDPDRQKAFKRLISLIKRNSLGLKEYQVKADVLDAMLKRGCLDNPNETSDFIVHQYFMSEKVGPILKAPRGFGVR